MNLRVKYEDIVRDGIRDAKLTIDRASVTIQCKGIMKTVFAMDESFRLVVEGNYTTMECKNEGIFLRAIFWFCDDLTIGEALCAIRGGKILQRTSVEERAKLFITEKDCRTLFRRGDL